MKGNTHLQLAVIFCIVFFFFGFYSIEDSFIFDFETHFHHNKNVTEEFFLDYPQFTLNSFF